MYKTETHLHTSEGSRCGKLTASEMVDIYHEAGYKTIFVTDHLYRDYFDRMGDISWKEKIDIFMSGYENALAAAGKYGMNIILSGEIQCGACPNHYLLYGIDKEFLNKRDDILDIDIEQFYKFAKENGVFIVQAHPFRDGKCHPTPEFADAIEVYNTNPRHNDFDDKAISVAKENALPMTSGSDAHRADDAAFGGVISEEPIESTEDYIRLLKSGKLEIICRG